MAKKSEGKSVLPFCCETSRRFSEEFATAARLYAEAVVVLTSTSGATSRRDFNHLCKAVEVARRRCEKMSALYEEHVEMHCREKTKTTKLRSLDLVKIAPNDRQGVENTAKVRSAVNRA